MARLQNQNGPGGLNPVKSGAKRPPAAVLPMGKVAFQFLDDEQQPVQRGGVMK